MFSTIPTMGIITLSNIVLAPNHICQRDFLRRCDQQRTADLKLLRKSDLHVAGSWRHVDDEIIQIAPMNIRHQLMQGLANIGPRQITAWSASRKKPIDITGTP